MGKDLRKRLYKHLAPEAWPQPGLSPTNKFIYSLIVFSALFAILETEKTIYDIAPSMFSLIEILIVSVFIVEYTARIYAVGEIEKYSGIRGRIRYIFSFWSIIDLLAILPFLLSFTSSNAFILRLLRLLRLMRVARLGRYSQAMTAIVEAISLRRYELTLSMAVAAIILVLSSACLYLLEGDIQEEAFGSIPRALWWSIATLTTVGYGDVTPLTALGKVFAAITAITGVGMIAMPTGILASAFSDILQKHKNQRD